MTVSKPNHHPPKGDYQVGYGKPPKAGQFQRQVRKPQRSPQSSAEPHEVILEEAARIAKVKVGDKIEHIDKDLALMRRLFDLGLHGNVAALRHATSLLAHAQASLVGFSATP